MKYFVTLSILLFAALASFAQQDTLIKRTDERIVCKVKEVGTDEVKYLLPGSDIVMVIDKNEVARIITAGGTVMIFTDSMKDLKPFEAQKKNLLKVQEVRNMMV